MRLSDDAIMTIYDLIDYARESERSAAARGAVNGTLKSWMGSPLYYKASQLKEEILRYEQESIKEKS